MWTEERGRRCEKRTQISYEFFKTLQCILSVITARNKRVIYVVVRQGHTFSHRVHHDDGGHRHNENSTRSLERALVQPVGSKAPDLIFMAP